MKDYFQFEAFWGNIADRSDIFVNRDYTIILELDENYNGPSYSIRYKVTVWN